MDVIVALLSLALVWWVYAKLADVFQSKAPDNELDALPKSEITSTRPSRRSTFAERAAEAALAHGRSARPARAPVAKKCAKGHDIPVRTYTVPLVGESNYQDAIDDCEVDDEIDLFHEPDNPYDDEAIAAVTKRGDTIGYIARSSWLREALLGEGQDCLATIERITGETKGMSGVVLSVALIDGEIATRKYKP